MKVKVVDDLMGSGKTSWAIDYINNNNDSQFIYITPYLKEVERVVKSCRQKSFYQPNRQSGRGSKLNDFHNLLQNEKNIVSTHSLFRLATDQTRELINAGNYTLILDEVMDVVEEVELKKSDLESLLRLKLITIEDNLIKWNEKNEFINDYDGRYNDIKNMAQNNCLFMVNDVILMWTFPINIFYNFKDIYILTYLFEGQIQKYYYDLYNIEYEYYKVFKNEDKYFISNESKNYKEIKDLLKEKIHIINDNINNIGDNEYSLSVTWFQKNRNEPIIAKLKNNLYNFFRNKVNASSKEIIWTTFKYYKTKIQGNGYTKRFIPVNSRATNEYRECKYLAYCCNIFLNPLIKHFFYQNKVTVNQEIYALSEMLQWIWRSAIRENNEVWLYLPSKRMRGLLTEWLNN